MRRVRIPHKQRAFYRANTIMSEGNDTKPGLLSQASMSAAEVMFDTF